MIDKNSSLLFRTTICFFLLLLSSVVEAQTTGITGYPPGGAPPPPVAEWTALVDTTKLPNAPVRNIDDPCGTTDPFCFWPCTICLRTNDTDIKACPQKTDWGLTFDDGPSENTPVVLDYLKSKNLKATFFVTGTSILKFPDVLKRTVQEGHQVGVHTWSHTPLTTQTTDVVIAEVKWTEKLIKEVAGVTPLYMRPPQGNMDDRIRGIMKQLKYKIGMWNRDTFDWTSNTDSNFDLNWITNNFTLWVNDKNITTGQTSLEHDLYPQTVAKAPGAIDIIMNAKFNIKPIADCIGQPAAFYLESNNSTSNSSNSTSSPTVSGNQKNSAVITISYNIFIITTCIFISFLSFL